MSKETQVKSILSHLKSGGTLTSLEALQKFNCMRLASRIYDIGKLGYMVSREKVSRGKKWYMEYSIKEAKS